jgi:hypothetical protein
VFSTNPLTLNPRSPVNLWCGVQRAFSSTSVDREGDADRLLSAPPSGNAGAVTAPHGSHPTELIFVPDEWPMNVAQHSNPASLGSTPAQ